MKTVNLEEIYNKHKDKFIQSFDFDGDNYFIDAMREACNQAIDIAAEVQASQYKDSGFTSTGKKINDLILNTKNQII